LPRDCINDIAGDRRLSPKPVLLDELKPFSRRLAQIGLREFGDRAGRGGKSDAAGQPSRCARRGCTTEFFGGNETMRFVLRIFIVGVLCLAIATGAVAWIVGLDGRGIGLHSFCGTSEADSAAAKEMDLPAPERNSAMEAFPDPNARGTPSYVYIARHILDGEIMSTAFAHTGTIHDPRSLDELRQAVRVRVRRGLIAFRDRYDRLHFDSPPTFEQAIRGIPLARSIAFLYMHEGKFDQAAFWLERAVDMSRAPNFSPGIEAGLHALRGIVDFRKGETENCLECVGPSSCIFPRGWSH